jgi:excisionase family DNA binding protein
MADRLPLSHREACQRLGVSRLTLIAEIEAGRLRYVLVGKRPSEGSGGRKWFGDRRNRQILEFGRTPVHGCKTHA